MLVNKVDKIKKSPLQQSIPSSTGLREKKGNLHLFEQVNPIYEWNPAWLSYRYE